MNRARLAVLVAGASLLAVSFAGCSAPPRRVPVRDVIVDAPASVASESLRVTIVSARRFDTLDASPGGKTALEIPLTCADGSVGAPVFAAALGYPVALATRAPFLFTLFDGFLRVDAEDGKHELRATVVESSKTGQAPPPLVAKDELWIWIGPEPSKEEPSPRGTFVGVRRAN